MNTIRLLLSFLLCSTYGWSQTSYGSPEVNPTTLQMNFQNWFNYQTTKIMLSTDFIGLDTKHNQISKDLFLQKLNSGTYIPIRLLPNEKIVYQLVKIAPKADTSIRATIM